MQVCLYRGYPEPGGTRPRSAVLRREGNLVRAGARWEDESVKPSNWRLGEQLAHVPNEFR